MEIQVKKTLGNSEMTFTIEEKDTKDALALASFFTQPDYCGLCKSRNGDTRYSVVWDSNKAQTDDGTFTYIKRKCLNPNCLATSTMGEYKGGGYFWKKWEIWEGRGDNVSDKDLGTGKASKKASKNEVNAEDVPF